MEPSDPIFILSLIIDLFMILDLPLQIMLLNLLRSRGVDELGHVFIRCLTCIIVCNICLYIVEIFIKEPACLGIFLPFYMDYANICGTIALMSSVACSLHSVFWNAILAVSRLIAVVAPMQFEKILNVTVMRWLTYILLTWTFVVTVPIATIGFRYYDKSNNSISFSMKGPTLVTRFYNYYVGYGTTTLIIATFFFYILASISLIYHRMHRTEKQLNVIAIKVTLFAFTSNLAKISHCYANIYNNLAAFVPELGLIEMDLDLYMFLLKIGNIVYAMGTTILMVIFFPNTRRKMLKFFMQKYATPVASTFARNGGVFVAQMHRPPRNMDSSVSSRTSRRTAPIG